jgi:tetratricopeptide (TPR) repeat protein
VCVVGYCTDNLETADFLFFGGPLANLLSALFFLFLVVGGGPGPLTEEAMCLAVFSGLVCLSSLWPRERTVTLPDGRILSNDGYRVMQLLIGGRVQRLQGDALRLIAERDNIAASKKYKRMARLFRSKPDRLRCLIGADMLTDRYELALVKHKKLQKITPLQSNDYSNAAMILSRMDELPAALEEFNKALGLAPDSVNIKSNIGFTYLLTAQTANAIDIFKDILSQAPDNTYALSNIGLARIQSGDIDQGLANIRQALSLNPSEAYAHRALGIYHLGRQQNSEAMACFKRAKGLDPDTYKIDELICQSKH